MINKKRLFLRLCRILLLYILTVIPASYANNAVSASLYSRANSSSQLFQLIDQRNWKSAFAAASANADPAIYKYLYWRYLRDDDTKPDLKQLTEFLQANPEWPGLRNILTKAEYVFATGYTPDEVITWFKKSPPQSIEGKRILADAYLKNKQVELAKPLIRQYWWEAQIDHDWERKMYAIFRPHLSDEDHQRRIAYMLRSKSYSAARNLAKMLGNGFPALVDAQIASIEGKKTASALYSKVPARLAYDPNLMLSIVKARRKADKNEQAIAWLNRQPKNLEDNIEEWWAERQVMVRRLIKSRSYAKAYGLVTHHGLKDGNSYIEAEFLSGWIALQKINRSDLAYEHFKNIYDHSTSSISMARSLYWLARTYEKTNDVNNARIWYANASKFPTAFYGQLARQHLGLDAVAFDLPRTPDISRNLQAQFDSNDVIKVIRFLSENGERQSTEFFVNHLANTAKTAEYMAMLIQLTHDINRPDLAVSISRISRQKGIDLIKPGFPQLELAGEKNIPEDALVHAIIRQESSFDPDAKSSAGALGLMQLMPSVASVVAKRLNINYRPSWLITRPEYNVKLGKLLLQQKIRSFENNYALAVAAYNAGPSRVRDWIDDNGDPRGNKIDMVDWIELIPYTETRGYVHRVLENLVIYRYLQAKDSTPGS